MTASSTIANPSSFHAEAMYQRVCANCGEDGGWDAHHVVHQQHLRKRGLPEWDTRNALRLCEGERSNRCHHRTEKQGFHLETQKLRDVNICYVWEALKMAGQNYLERHYTGVDRRFTLHIEGGCTCQQ